MDTQFDRITVDPDRLGGKPCIRELRISVGMVVQMVAAGKTIDEILAEYPYLEQTMSSRHWTIRCSC